MRRSLAATLSRKSIWESTSPLTTALTVVVPPLPPGYSLLSTLCGGHVTGGCGPCGESAGGCYYAPAAAQVSEHPCLRCAGSRAYHPPRSSPPPITKCCLCSIACHYSYVSTHCPPYTARNTLPIACRHKPDARAACHPSAVLARRFHKFWNVGELPEAEPFALARHALCGCTVSTKLDGSLVSPLLPTAAEGGDSELLWVTRVHPSHEVAQFVASRSACSSARYAAFAHEWIGRGYTPLFEWCEAARAAGVVQHAKDSLMLLALRHNISGEYLAVDGLKRAAEAHAIPLTPQWTLGEILGQEGEALWGDVLRTDGIVGEQAAAMIDALGRAVDAWDAVEGVVVQLTSRNGEQHLVKLKSCWWLSLAAAAKQAGTPFLLALLQKRPSLQAAPPEAVWSAMLDDKADDLISACAAILRRAGRIVEAAQLLSFGRAVELRVAEVERQLLSWGAAARSELRAVPTGREALQSEAERIGWSHSIAVALISGGDDATDERAAAARHSALIKQLRGAASRPSRVRALEALLWLVWGEWIGEAKLPSLVRREGGGNVQLTPLDAANGACELPPDGLVDHVVEAYLPRKLATFCGASAMTAKTAVLVPPAHDGDEGKIKGMWERFVSDGVLDLRVDLQPARLGASESFDQHHGDRRYALWLVQFGASKLSKKSSKSLPGDRGAGTYAGVLMRTGTAFCYSEVREAMRRSFELRCYIRMDVGEPASGDIAAVETARNAIPVPTSPDATDPLAVPAPASSEGATWERDGPNGVIRWRIFCDLDGVLADFNGGVRALAAARGKVTGDLSLKEMWRMVASERDFFARLKWTVDVRAAHPTPSHTQPCAQTRTRTYAHIATTPTASSTFLCDEPLLLHAI